MDEYQTALEEMKQAQAEYTPEQQAHDAYTELLSLVKLVDHWSSLTLKEAAILEQAMLIAKGLANGRY